VNVPSDKAPPSFRTSSSKSINEGTLRRPAVLFFFRGFQLPLPASSSPRTHAGEVSSTLVETPARRGADYLFFQCRALLSSAGSARSLVGRGTVLLFRQLSLVSNRSIGASRTLESPEDKSLMPPCNPISCVVVAIPLPYKDRLETPFQLYSPSRSVGVDP